MSHDDKLPPEHPHHHPRHAARWLAGLLALVIVYFGGMALHEASQQAARALNDARHLTGGEPTRAPALMRRYGCAGCHTIPGVAGADGLIGPPLAGIANRMYVGGVVTNTPRNMVQWLLNPKAIDPKTAMPVTGLTEGQARDIAAYLYTMR